MIEFFRDILDGPIYIIVAILSLIFIMAIIGFMMERNKLAKEEKARITYVNNKIDVPEKTVETKTEQVKVPPVAPVTQVKTTEQNPNSNNNDKIPQQQDNNPELLVKTPVVVFEDPDKNK